MFQHFPCLRVPEQYQLRTVFSRRPSSQGLWFGGLGDVRLRNGYREDSKIATQSSVLNSKLDATFYASQVGVFKAGTSSRLLDLFENLRRRSLYPT